MKHNQKPHQQQLLVLVFKLGKYFRGFHPEVGMII